MDCHLILLNETHSDVSVKGETVCGSQNEVNRTLPSAQKLKLNHQISSTPRRDKSPKRSNISTTNQMLHFIYSLIKSLLNHTLQLKPHPTWTHFDFMTWKSVSAIMSRRKEVHIWFDTLFKTNMTNAKWCNIVQYWDDTMTRNGKWAAVFIQRDSDIKEHLVIYQILIQSDLQMRRIENM